MGTREGSPWPCYLRYRTERTVNRFSYSLIPAKTSATVVTSDTCPLSMPDPYSYLQTILCNYQCRQWQEDVGEISAVQRSEKTQGWMPGRRLFFLVLVVAGILPAGLRAGHSGADPESGQDVFIQNEPGGNYRRQYQNVSHRSFLPF